MVQEVVAARPDAEPFGLSSVTAEINQRFKAALKQPADLRTVPAALRRMLDHRRIRLIREGKPYYEALYAKGTEKQGVEQKPPANLSARLPRCW